MGGTRPQFCSITILWLSSRVRSRKSSNLQKLYDTELDHRSLDDSELLVKRPKEQILCNHPELDTHHMNAHVWTLLTKSLLDTKLISSCNSAISLSISLAWHRFKVSQAWSRLIISHFYHFGSWKKISQTIGNLGVLQPIEIKYMGSHCTVPTPTRAPLCLRSFLTNTAFSITFTHSMLN